MTKVEFDKWVDEMIEKYANDNNIFVKRFCDKTYIAYNFKTNKVGMARCHPDDEFNRETGIAIAYARCKGIEVPKISTYKKFCELKNGDRFSYGNIYYLFIGKCLDDDNEYCYAIQNLTTHRIKTVSTIYYNAEVEMIE